MSRRAGVGTRPTHTELGLLAQPAVHLVMHPEVRLRVTPLHNHRDLDDRGHVSPADAVLAPPHVLTDDDGGPISGRQAEELPQTSPPAILPEHPQQPQRPTEQHTCSQIDGQVAHRVLPIPVSDFNAIVRLLSDSAGSSQDEDMPPADRVAHLAPLAFDGERFLLQGVTVLTEGSRILSVSAGQTAVPEGFAERRHERGTLLPGLIDTHVHLIADGKDGALGRDPDRTPEEREAMIRQSLLAHARAGVTTVRDLGDNRYSVLGRASQHDEPAVVASGPPITTPGGHCVAMGGEAAGVEQLLRAVDERAEHGAALVKIVVSGGAMTPGSDLLSLQYSPEDVAWW